MQNSELLACPRCGGTLALLVEPGVLEFYCQNDHTFDIEGLVFVETTRARRLLQETLAFWVDRQESLLRTADTLRREGQPDVSVMYEKQLLVGAERIRTLRVALEKCG